MAIADFQCIFGQQIKEGIVLRLHLTIGFHAAVEIRYAFLDQLAETGFELLQRVYQEAQRCKHQRQYQQDAERVGGSGRKTAFGRKPRANAANYQQHQCQHGRALQQTQTAQALIERFEIKVELARRIHQ